MHAFGTIFDEVALVWSEERGSTKVRRVFLSSPGLSAGMAAAAGRGSPVPGSNPVTAELADRIDRTLAGGDEDFDLSIVDLSLCGDFQRSVLLTESRIPRGEVWSYSRLAEESGNSGMYRATGRALSANPFPVIIPCHRTVKSDGSPGGYQGGTLMKLALLRMEGAVFLSSGRLMLSVNR